MTREQMIADLVYNDVYGDREEFLKRVLRHGWKGYEYWETDALVWACKEVGIYDESETDDDHEDVYPLPESWSNHEKASWDAGVPPYGPL